MVRVARPAAAPPPASAGGACACRAPAGAGPSARHRRCVRLRLMVQPSRRRIECAVFQPQRGWRAMSVVITAAPDGGIVVSPNGAPGQKAVWTRRAHVPVGLQRAPVRHARRRCAGAARQRLDRALRAEAEVGREHPMAASRPCSESHTATRRRRRPHSDYVIETEGLDLCYGRKKALNQLTLRIPRGRIHAIVGANGAGKSSLFRILLGVQSPTAGRATILGHDCTRAHRARARTHRFRQRGAQPARLAARGRGGGHATPAVPELGRAALSEHRRPLPRVAGAAHRRPVARRARGRQPGDGARAEPGAADPRRADAWASTSWPSARFWKRCWAPSTT